MKKIVFGILIFLMGFTQAVNAMQASTQALSADQLLQEYSVKRAQLTANLLPKGDISTNPSYFTKFMHYRTAITQLAQHYLDKLRAINPAAAAKIVSLVPHWRTLPTPQDRRVTLMHMLISYKRLWHAHHRGEFESKAHEEQNRQRIVTLMPSLLGLTITDDLSQLTDQQISYLAHSFLV